MKLAVEEKPAKPKHTPGAVKPTPRVRLKRLTIGYLNLIT